MVTVKINDKQVTFDLEEKDGEVELVVTHVDGVSLTTSFVAHSRILWIDEKGNLNRFSHVNKDTGLNLNSDREIKKGNCF